MSQAFSLSHIVAASQNHVIGFKNKLPWHIPKDLTYFYKTTKHRIIIMGRKTFQSMPQALPHRLNIVLTKDPHLKAQGAEIFLSFEEALKHCKQLKIINQYHPEIFITGGSEIYKQSLAYTNLLYVTRIHKNYTGDTFYPQIPEQFKQISCIKHENEPIPFSFLIYKNQQKPLDFIVNSG